LNLGPKAETLLILPSLREIIPPYSTVDEEVTETAPNGSDPKRNKGTGISRPTWIRVHPQLPKIIGNSEGAPTAAMILWGKLTDRAPSISKLLLHGRNRNLPM